MRGREGGREGEREKERERSCTYLHVCVCTIVYASIKTIPSRKFNISGTKQVYSYLIKNPIITINL